MQSQQVPCAFVIGFCTNVFQILQMFLSRPEDVHEVWIDFLDCLFLWFKLSTFSDLGKYCVPHVGNSSVFCQSFGNFAGVFAMFQDLHATSI